MIDKRLIDLTRWSEEIIGDTGIEVSPASFDASFRRYFRIRSGDRSYIVMDAPPEKEDIRPFIHAATRLIAIGLHVPEILHRDTAQGFLLLSDLGDQTYLEQLHAGSVERLYGDALAALIVLQVGTYTDPRAFPEYSDALLLGEMELFRDWYVGRHLNRTLSATQHKTLTKTFSSLVAMAQSQPKVWVHRDYHSRNLMVTPSNNPGILDFQDAVVGPITYDMVSLLRDCYIAWPQARVEAWVDGYLNLALQSGLPVEDDDRKFKTMFDWMGVQRHLKVLGIFSRLHYRDGKSNFLNDLPLVHHYLIEVCGRHTDLHPLQELLLGLTPARD